MVTPLQMFPCRAQHPSDPSQKPLLSLGSILEWWEGLGAEGQASAAVQTLMSFFSFWASIFLPLLESGVQDDPEAWSWGVGVGPLYGPQEGTWCDAQLSHLQLVPRKHTHQPLSLALDCCP